MVRSDLHALFAAKESSLQEGKHNSPPTLEASESSLAQEANEPSVVVGLHSRVFEV